MENDQINFIEVEETPSTQLLGREWLEAHSNPAQSSWFRANYQSAGRGRQGRLWEDNSHGSNLLCTYAFHFKGVESERPLISLVAGLAVWKLFKTFFNEDAYPLALKWPNDLVYVSGNSFKKLGGIITEAFSKDAIVVGWGINLTKKPGPTVVATSLKEVPGVSRKPPKPQELLLELNKFFQAELTDWQMDTAGYPKKLIQELNDKAMSPFWGREGSDPRGQRAIALGLDSSGALRVKNIVDSVERLVSAGDFKFLNGRT